MESQPFVAGQISVLGLILSSSPYLRSGNARFPLWYSYSRNQPSYSKKLSLTSPKQQRTFPLEKPSPDWEAQKQLPWQMWNIVTGISYLQFTSGLAGTFGTLSLQYVIPSSLQVVLLFTYMWRYVTECFSSLSTLSLLTCFLFTLVQQILCS